MTLAYILSLPRSGSTVLSALLDRRQGIVSPPESSFPQVLSVIKQEERGDTRMMAALYLGATFVPTPLSLAEAQACMIGTDQEILIALGLAIATKLDRNPSEVEAIVWKTPRTVGFHKVPLASGGKFIILRRNPHNVFESQFRVDFGANNRNPYRFAIFRESYEHAFGRLPENRVFELAYDDLPECLESLISFLGVKGTGEWKTMRSSLDMAAEGCYWMKEVTKEFKNTDAEKRARLDSAQVARLELALKLARPLRPFMGPLRSHFDHASMGPIRERAQAALNAASV